jgi:hypothetical protein
VKTALDGRHPAALRAHVAQLHSGSPSPSPGPGPSVSRIEYWFSPHLTVAPGYAQYSWSQRFCAGWGLTFRKLPNTVQCACFLLGWFSNLGGFGGTVTVLAWSDHWDRGIKSMFFGEISGF